MIWTQSAFTDEKWDHGGAMAGDSLLKGFEMAELGLDRLRNNGFAAGHDLERFRRT